MKKNAILIISIGLVLSAQAKEYRCFFDISPKGKVITREKSKDYIKYFHFDSGKKKIGTQVSFKDYDIKMWVKNGMSITLLKDIKKKMAITTKSHLDQKSIYLKISPNVLLECLSPKDWEKKNKGLQSMVVPKIDDQTNLSEVKHNLSFEINRDILFQYIQANSNDKMRTIIFQDGKLIRDSYKKDSDKEWCAFQVEIKLDEDTVIYNKTKLPPTRVRVLNNSSTRYVVSYSFVDFSSGKRKFHTSRYTPFSLECQIPKKKVLSYKLFREITGDYFTLQGSPQ